MHVWIHVKDVGVHVVTHYMLQGPEPIIDMEGAQVRANRVDGGDGRHGEVTSSVHEFRADEPVRHREPYESPRFALAPRVQAISRDGKPHKVLYPLCPSCLHGFVYIPDALLSCGRKVLSDGHLHVVVEGALIPFEERFFNVFTSWAIVPVISGKKLMEGYIENVTVWGE